MASGSGSGAGPVAGPGTVLVRPVGEDRRRRPSEARLVYSGRVAQDSLPALLRSCLSARRGPGARRRVKRRSPAPAPSAAGLPSRRPCLATTPGRNADSCCYKVHDGHSQQGGYRTSERSPTTQGFSRRFGPVVDTARFTSRRGIARLPALTPAELLRREDRSDRLFALSPSLLLRYLGELIDG